MHKRHTLLRSSGILCLAVVIALRPQISAQPLASLVMFPIRTAVSIPFVEFATLLMMWREIHDEKGVKN